MQCSVAMAGMGWGWWGVKGGHCGIRGEQPKHGPHQLRGHSPEESTQPLPGAASDLLGLGNVKGTALDRELLVVGWGSVVCEPSGLSGARMSRCHVQRKQHSFPCGWVEKQQEPCWESSEKPEGFFLLRVKPKYSFPHECFCPGEGAEWVGREMVLWPHSTPKSAFFSSMWAQQGVAEGSSQGRGVPSHSRGAAFG